MSRQQLRLQVLHGRNTLCYDLPRRGTVVVGRLQSCDVAVQLPTISRRHLKLTISDQGLEVEDLGSANGTVVAGSATTGSDDTHTLLNKSEARLTPGSPVSLRPGDWLRVGSVLMVVDERVEEIASDENGAWLGPVVASELMKRVHDWAARAAQAELPVLLLGETGVGKEVVAELIHQRSKRAKGPFLRLNCAALTESLLESELFGYEKGAFTGALKDRPGLFESTNGGTVFLDEVGELPLTTQAKLLRVLEERMVRRVGGTRARPIDVRFVAATNRSLEEEIERGRFRRDLFFRINTFRIDIPPLRQRPEEIEILAHHFLARACKSSGLPLPEISPPAMESMKRYPWPGNLRELRNTMERAVVLAANGVVLPEHVPSGPMDSPFDDTEHTETLDCFVPESRSAPRSVVDGSTGNERDRIIEALEACAGNQTRAARMLRISRRTLVTKLDLYGLPRPRKAREAT